MIEDTPIFAGSSLYGPFQELDLKFTLRANFTATK